MTLDELRESYALAKSMAKLAGQRLGKAQGIPQRASKRSRPSRSR